jgi:Fungal specific transcription factor domain
MDLALWKRIVLQASETEESIRHAAISIGALELTMAPSHPHDAPGKCCKTTNVESQQHVFALEQYSKSIKGLYQKPGRLKADLRTVLIASILIICFETLHQNHSLAATQVWTTVRLIESRGTEPGSRDYIEEDLLCMFDRLQLRAMSSIDY